MPASTVTTRTTSAKAVRSTSPFLRRIALCVGLTALNIFVVAKFAGVFYQAAFRTR